MRRHKSAPYPAKFRGMIAKSPVWVIESLGTCWDVFREGGREDVRRTTCSPACHRDWHKTQHEMARANTDEGTSWNGMACLLLRVAKEGMADGTSQWAITTPRLLHHTS